MIAARPPLLTGRLVLEPIEPRHSQGLWRAKDASFTELRRWMAWAEQAREAQDDFVRSAHEQWGQGEWVYVISFNGEPAGTVGIDRHQPLISSADIGYWLRTDVTGRGLMTEAAAAVVDWAFHELALHRLELRAGVENYASVRVAEKLGFRRGGILRHGARNPRNYYDVYVFDLLATDERPGARAKSIEANQRPPAGEVRPPSPPVERPRTAPRND